MSNKQLLKGKSGLRMVSTSDEDRSPFLLEEPHWEDDALFPNCVKCNIKFDFTHRRHHCRRCGRIFCGRCCDNKVMLERLSFVDPVRVCEQCSHIAKKEEEFFNKHLKLLCHGARFIIDDSAPLTFVCKMENKTHRTILFECDGDAHHDPVALISLVSVQLITEKEGEHVNGIVLKYKEDGNVLEVRLHAVSSPEAERKHSLAWIVAMQRARYNIFPFRARHSLENNVCTAIKMLFEVGS